MTNQKPSADNTHARTAYVSGRLIKLATALCNGIGAPMVNNEPPQFVTDALREWSNGLEAMVFQVVEEYKERFRRYVGQRRIVDNANDNECEMRHGAFFVDLNWAVPENGCYEEAQIIVCGYHQDGEVSDMLHLRTTVSRREFENWAERNADHLRRYNPNAYVLKMSTFVNEFGDQNVPGARAAGWIEEPGAPKAPEAVVAPVAVEVQGRPQRPQRNPRLDYSDRPSLIYGYRALLEKHLAAHRPTNEQRQCKNCKQLPLCHTTLPKANTCTNCKHSCHTKCVNLQRGGLCVVCFRERQEAANPPPAGKSTDPK